MPPTGGQSTPDAGVGTHRDRLFGIAYRMLGSVAEAEDAVQEAFARLAAAGGVEDPAAWLTRVVTNVSIDRLRSAQRRRETYVGPWLPEPLLTDDRDPSDIAETADSLTLAFLVVLERLSPTERAVFLLHDVVFTSDGGGVVPAARRPVHGAEGVASFLLGLARLGSDGSWTLAPASVNGQPGLVAEHDGEVDVVFALHIDAGRIVAIHAVRNPDKLAAVRRQLASPPPHHVWSRYTLARDGSRPTRG